MDRRLRPFHYLPDEVLSPIFDQVQADWNRLPSPFQLAHVCSQWRRVAYSTPSLWQDTRILRIAIKMPLEDQERLSPPIRKAYCFSGTGDLPGEDKWHPRGRNHRALLRHCASKSRNTLTHFEFETRNAHPEIVYDILSIARSSAGSLTSISLVNRDKDAEFAGQCFNLVLNCPLLTHLELSMGKVDADYFEEIERGLRSLSQKPATLRTLRIDGFDCFATSTNSLLDRLLLQRCSRLESVTLMEDESRSRRPGLVSFGVKLLKTCANTLVELETTPSAELFFKCKDVGLTSLPRLRRFRHAPTQHDWDGGNDLHVIDFPKLESLEGPLDFPRYLDKVPARLVLRFNQRFIFHGDDIAAWLLNTPDDDWDFDGCDFDELSDLTIELLGQQRCAGEVSQIIDALTPTVAGELVCPRLSSFTLRFKDEYAEDYAEVSPFDLSSPSKPPPLYREQWEAQVDVSSRLLRMETERRRLSRHRPLDKKQRKLTDFPAAFTPTSHEALKAKARAPCAALHTITLEGCHVDEAAWEAMKKSACDFKVSPDPQEMAKLPYEEEPKKKKKVRFEKEPKDEQKGEKKRKSPWG